MPAAIETVAETGSTNADLLARARLGVAEGTWLRAERQTAGRGRMGRAWASPAGNLYASTLVRLRSGDPPAATLALVSAVALDEVAGAYAEPARVQLKWPNDLLLATAAGWGKLSGILLERADAAVVIGFGVNLASAPVLPDRPSAALADVTEAPDPGLFADELALSVARWLALWRGAGLAPIRARWLARAHPVGTPLVARTADGAAAEGLFAGLDASGALLLRTAERTLAIAAADVFLL